MFYARQHDACVGKFPTHSTLLLRTYLDSSGRISGHEPRIPFIEAREIRYSGRHDTRGTEHI